MMPTCSAKQLCAMLIGAMALFTANAQDSIALFHPDSVFTLTQQDIEQERIQANQLIAGTWQYDKPCVQAQGTSLVGKIGKPIAQGKLKKKLSKAYDKLRIGKRWNSLRLTTDGRWTMNIAGQDINGKYSYSPSKGTITLKWMAISVTAHVKKEKNNLNLYFDTDRLLTIMRLISGISHNDTLKALAFLSENYQDVQVGFQLKPKK